MAKALLLGSTGMLGSAVADELSKAGVSLSVASRTQGIKFDAKDTDLGPVFSAAALVAGDFIVNCIGLTKSRIDEKSRESRSLAVDLNVNFPSALALEAEKNGYKVIQVATDCVFSGLRGNYSELDPHDSLDVYGKTKSLGEVPSDAVMHLRCSLIGPEQGRSSLFFEWVRQQPKGAQISGYTNHIWNGLTSKVFGQVVAGVIQHNLFKPGVQHLVPADKLTKDELVRLELSALGRDDVKVQSIAAEDAVDRTLSTTDLARNKELFQAAGYAELPRIRAMVEEICQELPN
jgi:dTDP-4-dehydrorhamnose reductase